ncbi:MAG: hypothetical protein IJM37_02680 [Lachnospiraceae bacterium]|nr:hypothetical protein [Lachnospiraceae bacterium]
MKRVLALFLSVAMMLSMIMVSPPQKAQAAGMSVCYTAHIQTYGDSQGWVCDGAVCGTTGQAKRLEALKVKLSGDEYDGDVVYKTHVQSLGWLNWCKNGAFCGTQGQAKRLEAVQLYLTGEVAKHYDITYRVHVQSYGWLNWVANGALSGTTGQAKRLEAIQIKLVPKDGDSQKPSSGNGTIIVPPSGNGTIIVPPSGNGTIIVPPSGNGNTAGQPSANNGNTANVPSNSGSVNSQNPYRQIRQQVVDLCNQYRAQNGITNMLTLDDTLTKAADIRAKEIVTNFSHTRPDGTRCFTVLEQFGYKYRAVGENIASGYINPQKVMEAWMNSSGHRANILNSSFNKIGVGYYETKSGYRYYWAQMFSN